MKLSRVGAPAAEKPTVADRESGIVVARESRRYARRPAFFAARLSTLKADLDPKTHASFYVLTEARTRDVGDAGLGLEVDDVVAEGQRVLIELDLPDGSILTTPASVMWCTHDRDTHYLGLCFDDPVPGLIERV